MVSMREWLLEVTGEAQSGNLHSRYDVTVGTGILVRLSWIMSSAITTTPM